MIIVMIQFIGRIKGSESSLIAMEVAAILNFGEKEKRILGPFENEMRRHSTNIPEYFNVLQGFSGPTLIKYNCIERYCTI